VKVGDLVKNKELFPPIGSRDVGLIVKEYKLSSDNRKLYTVWYGSGRYASTVGEDLILLSEVNCEE
tara:strand:+ start:1440 stop:1637 length:198 start_codon:yes stop_codon:yes gene_type:complete